MRLVGDWVVIAGPGRSAYPGPLLPIFATLMLYCGKVANVAGRHSGDCRRFPCKRNAPKRLGTASFACPANAATSSLLQIRPHRSPEGGLIHERIDPCELAGTVELAVRRYQPCHPPEHCWLGDWS